MEALPKMVIDNHVHFTLDKLHSIHVLDMSKKAKLLSSRPLIISSNKAKLEEVERIFNRLEREAK